MPTIMDLSFLGLQYGIGSEKSFVLKTNFELKPPADNAKHALSSNANRSATIFCAEVIRGNVLPIAKRHFEINAQIFLVWEQVHI